MNLVNTHTNTNTHKHTHSRTLTHTHTHLKDFVVIRGHPYVAEPLMPQDELQQDASSAPDVGLVS